MCLRSCVLLKLSRVKLALISLQTFALRCVFCHIVLQAKEELFRRVIFVKDFVYATILAQLYFPSNVS